MIYFTPWSGWWTKRRRRPAVGARHRPAVWTADGEALRSPVIWTPAIRTAASRCAAVVLPCRSRLSGPGLRSEGSSRSRRVEQELTQPGDEVVIGQMRVPDHVDSQAGQGVRELVDP